MIIFSIYESMQQSAKLCPDSDNIKLILRHSIRQEMNDDDIFDAMLTREGIILARRFGKELDVPIGAISSSFSQRCIDTCKNILLGNSSNMDIQRSRALQTSQNSDDIIAGESFVKYGSNSILKTLMKNQYIPGLNFLEVSVNKMLDYIFQIGNKKKTVDIFCTHDFQMAMLLLFFYRNNSEFCDDLFENWIYMLEGLFIYGDREKFTFIWRGIIGTYELASN